MDPGTQLLELVRSAKNSLAIVSPFIKIGALQRIIETNPNLKITCITRFRPEDIAASVCDVEIFDLLDSIPSANLYMHLHLHAKYYRADDTCLVGSANITFPALAWSMPANIELLVEQPASPTLLDWEKDLIQSSTAVTKDLCKKIAEAAQRIESSRTSSEESFDLPSTQYWYPTFRTPELLWDVYNGTAEDKMPDSSHKAALKDLQSLRIPSDLRLTRDQFTEFVRNILRCTALFQQIDRMTESGMTDQEGMELLRNFNGSIDPSKESQNWNAVKSWLVYFMGDTYLRRHRGEIITKGKRIQ